MLDVAICIDNVVELEYMSCVVTDYSRERPEIPIRIRRFQSLYDLTDRISLGRVFHICLLDHPRSLPWMGRLSAESTLRRADPGISIIGFTANEEAAFLAPFPEDSLRLEACLLKPTSIAQLYGVLDRVAGQRLAELSPAPVAPPPVLSLPTRRGERSLPFSRLIRAHYRAHVVTCCMEDGEEVRSSVLRVPFNQVIQPLLQSGGFSWASASCVVNLAFVEELDKKASTVRTRDGEVIPVPRAVFPGLREHLRRYQGSLLSDRK